MHTPQPTTHRISADHVLLLLVTRKMPSLQTRWAAMSNGTATPACGNRCRGDAWRLKFNPMLSPMQRGRMHDVVQRTRRQDGLPEVRRTWGAGLKAMLAETTGAVLLKGGAQ